MKPTKDRFDSELSDAVAREIESLKGPKLAEMRRVWEERFKAAPPPIQSADVLMRLYAWKIQVAAFGDLDPETKRRLSRLKRALRKGKDVLPTASMNLRPGSILVREWQGVEHRVLVLDEGFEHRGERYRSLSQVAFAITGTKWSGPRFFGLTGEEAKRREARGQRA